MSREAMQQALEALEQVEPYVEQLVDYSSTASEWPLNLAPQRVAAAIAALRAALEAQQEPTLKVGNLPTLNQDGYPGLGEWWVQLWAPGDDEPGTVVARAYGATPEEARQIAERLAAGFSAPQPAHPPAQPQGWVPVAERLPKPDSGEVLVHLSSGVYALDEWHTHREDPLGLSTEHTIDMGHMWRTFDFDEVTHWMPLPPAPK